MVVFFKNKKGQVTLFIILGIIIVVVALLVLHTRTNLFLFNPSVEDLNNQLEGINEHVVDCIFEVGEEPIRRIGLQGGYLGASSGTYMFYNDLYCNYYVNKKIPMVGFINVGTFVGAFLGYNIHNLLTNNN